MNGSEVGPVVAGTVAGLAADPLTLGVTLLAATEPPVGGEDAAPDGGGGALSAPFPGGREVDVVVVVVVGAGVGGGDGGREVGVLVVDVQVGGIVVDEVGEQHWFTLSCTAGDDDWPT
ncbi:MAG TPA: hypothetical protein VHW93_09185 [Acidimicrobiales bacterium]|nr:hypothetical protein [Acidimicrobiales bacterium]